MASDGNALTPERWHALAEEWLARARHLELQAARIRLYGDFVEADEIADAALDYRVAAEALELGLAA